MANNDNPTVAQLVQTVDRLMQHGEEQMEQHEQTQLQVEQMTGTLMNLLAVNSDNPNAAQLVQRIEQLLQQRQELVKQHEQIQHQLFQMMETLMKLSVVNSLRQKEVPQIERPVADEDRAEDMLADMMNRKKSNAGKQPMPDTLRSQKRKRVEDSPIFHQSKESSRPDEAAFCGRWGIRNCDSMLEDSQLAVNWSQGSVTSTDRSHRTTLVEGTPVDSVRALNRQALASANIRFMHQINQMSKEVEIVSWDNTTLREEVALWKERHDVAPEEDPPELASELRRSKRTVKEPAWLKEFSRDINGRKN